MDQYKQLMQLEEQLLIIIRLMEGLRMQTCLILMDWALAYFPLKL